MQIGNGTHLKVYNSTHVVITSLEIKLCLPSALKDNDNSCSRNTGVGPISSAEWGVAVVELDEVVSWCCISLTAVRVILLTFYQI